MQICHSYNFQIGPLWLAEKEGALTHIVFSASDPGLKNVVEGRTPLLDSAAQQLQEYFLGKRTCFQLPILPTGTPFQLKVWRLLQEIAYGETKTYQELAVRIGNPRSARAVGAANGANPISIVIPCHRLVGQNGKLTGYGGGLKTKQFLLELERKHV